jgi:hypothetical protein
MFILCLTESQWPPETIIAVTVSGVLLLILIVVIGVWFIARSRFKKIPDRPDFTSINPDYERKKFNILEEINCKLLSIKQVFC